MSLTDKVAQFDADSDLVNAWVHGPASGVGSTVTTEAGAVRTPAKLIADNEAEIQVVVDLASNWANGPITGTNSTVTMGGATVKSPAKLIDDKNTEINTGAASVLALSTAQAVISTTQAGIATTQAGLATTNGAAQVALATTQANLATTNGAAQVALATTQAGLATTNGAAQVTLATAQVTLATSAKTAAESARDAAAVTGKVYATTAAGISATTTGQYFSVPSADSTESLILYLNSTGTAVEQKRYPSTNAISILQLANEYGSARQRYLDDLRTTGVTKPKAAVVILLGQSLNAPRGTIVQAKAGPVAKMPFGGTGIASWQFNGTNAEWVGHWSELASVVDYEERTGQTPGAGIISTLLGGRFTQAYIGNGAIGARSLAVLSTGGPLTNLRAMLNRLCQLARDNGFDPQVMFYTAHGEANAAASTTEASYYTQGLEYYGLAQLYAAQAMRKPDYIAPVVFTHVAAGSVAGATYSEVTTAIRRIAADLPGGIDLGGIYQWPVDTDRTHPTPAGYVQRGEAVGRALKQFCEGGRRPEPLVITDVTLSGSTFVATFSGPVQRDTTISAGENLNTALAQDGFEWFDNSTGIAVNTIAYEGWKVRGTLASAPVGTLPQQILRIATQTISGGLIAGAVNLAGSVVRMNATGWPSLYDYTYTNYVYANPQTFTSVRAA